MTERPGPAAPDPRGARTGRNLKGGGSFRSKSAWLLTAALLVLATALLVLPTGPGAAAAEAPERAPAAASCVAAGCHPDVAAREHLHWPEAAEPGQCQRCHEQEGDLHAFQSEEPPDLCQPCHEELLSRIEEVKFLHDPAEEDCLECHDPHGGATRALLEDVSAENQRGLCFTCHEKSEVFEGSYEHDPAAAGTCTACHDPHASKHESLLRARSTDLCAECHEELLELIDSAEYVHDPAEDECLECHGPHSGAHPGLLSVPGRKLCAECHEDVVEDAEEARVKHAAITTEAECTNCHSPHAAEFEPNLKKSVRETCLGCHDQRIPSERGMLADIKETLESNPVWHEPVREQDCTSCHPPHGSKHAHLLSKPFPDGFYSAFSVKAYAHCFSCHEPTLATEQTTRSLTGFRDGDRNLHYVHVNEDRRGRTCSACHDPHAARTTALILETTRYGAWMMPIEYEALENGGSCAPGCHEKLAYDRDAGQTSVGD